MGRYDVMIVLRAKRAVCSRYTPMRPHGQSSFRGGDLERRNASRLDNVHRVVFTHRNLRSKRLESPLVELKYHERLLSSPSFGLVSCVVVLQKLRYLLRTYILPCHSLIRDRKLNRTEELPLTLAISSPSKIDLNSYLVPTARFGRAANVRDDESHLSLLVGCYWHVPVLLHTHIA